MEIDIETQTCVIARAHGYETRKVQWIGRTSAFDRAFFGRGRCVFIEFKDTGKSLGIQQQREYNRLAPLYPDIHICDNLADARRILGI